MGGNLKLHKEITDKIIKVCYKVYNTMGYGFLEKIYKNSVAIALRKAGLKVEQQKNIKVYCEAEEVGDYYTDLLVENLVIIEGKATKTLADKHEAQLVNYLKASIIEIGLLINLARNQISSEKFLRIGIKRI